jgi:hypothetical protein
MVGQKVLLFLEIIFKKVYYIFFIKKVNEFIWLDGDVAQMGERYVRNVQAGGSIPPISTIFFRIGVGEKGF